MNPTQQAPRSRIQTGLGLVAILAAAASSALMFTIAEDGYSSLEHLVLAVKIPAILALIIIYLVARSSGWKWLSGALWTGLWVGAVSTVGLEIIRIVGFRAFHSMPGDMPTLMGVLMTGRIMQGPDALSTVLGYADHFWNGAVWGILYVLLLGKRRWWIGTAYAVVIGTLFQLSPVVQAIGAGYFGSQMGPKFAITVYLAHLVFGSAMGWLVARSRWPGGSWFGRVFATGLGGPAHWG